MAAIFILASVNMRWVQYSMNGCYQSDHSLWCNFPDIFRIYAAAGTTGCYHGIRPIFIYTHDSIGLGEDGTTHQPVEQLISLRAIPNLTVYPPCRCQ